MFTVIYAYSRAHKYNGNITNSVLVLPKLPLISLALTYEHVVKCIYMPLLPFSSCFQFVCMRFQGCYWSICQLTLNLKKPAAACSSTLSATFIVLYPRSCKSPTRPYNGSSNSRQFVYHVVASKSLCQPKGKGTNPRRSLSRNRTNISEDWIGIFYCACFWRMRILFRLLSTGWRILWMKIFGRTSW